MKFQATAAATVLSATAQVQALANPTVTVNYHDAAASVLGDATFPVEGDVSGVCSGLDSDPNHPNRCPDAGAVAIANCHEGLKSYQPDGTCKLPRDAWCQKLPNSETVGCILSPAPVDNKIHVVGDATYEVTLADGQGLCGVNGGQRCPNKDEETTENCSEKSFSYNPDTKKCKLNQDAWCWGTQCVIHEIPNQMEVTKDGVSYGIFNVDLADGQKLCGNGDGIRCPNQGDFALQNCNEHTPGYDAATGNCVLPMDAWCNGECVPRWDQ